MCLLLSWVVLALLNDECLSKNANTSLASTAVKVGYVLGIHEVRGCGCIFYWPGEENNKDAKNIFSSEDFGKVAWMNLNGKDVQLDQLESTAPMDKIKKGSRYHIIYRYHEMQIRIDYKVAWACRPDKPESESCKFTQYDLKITFSQNGNTNAVFAKGVCGC
jgi:hypothetical protein